MFLLAFLYLEIQRIISNWGILHHLSILISTLIVRIEGDMIFKGYFSSFSLTSYTPYVDVYYLLDGWDFLGISTL